MILQCLRKKIVDDFCMMITIRLKILYYHLEVSRITEKILIQTY